MNDKLTREQTLLSITRQEPEWAASRMAHLEREIDVLRNALNEAADTCEQYGADEIRHIANTSISTADAIAARGKEPR